MNVSKNLKPRTLSTANNPKKIEQEWDREIKRRLQAVEEEIPATLDSTFFSQLDHIQPDGIRIGKNNSDPKRIVSQKPHHPMRFLATAATILLAALIVFYSFFYAPSKQQTQNHEDNNQIMIASAHMEGKPANVYIVNRKDPNLTIVWVEKQSKNEQNEQ